MNFEEQIEKKSGEARHNLNLLLVRRVLQGCHGLEEKEIENRQKENSSNEKKN
jgi:hypothetical protein